MALNTIQPWWTSFFSAQLSTSPLPHRFLNLGYPTSPGPLFRNSLKLSHSNSSQTTWRKKHLEDSRIGTTNSLQKPRSFLSTGRSSKTCHSKSYLSLDASDLTASLPHWTTSSEELYLKVKNSCLATQQAVSARSSRCHTLILLLLHQSTSSSHQVPTPLEM